MKSLDRFLYYIGAPVSGDNTVLATAPALALFKRILANQWVDGNTPIEDLRRAIKHPTIIGKDIAKHSGGIDDINTMFKHVVYHNTAKLIHTPSEFLNPQKHLEDFRGILHHDGTLAATAEVHHTGDGVMHVHNVVANPFHPEAIQHHYGAKMMLGTLREFVHHPTAHTLEAYPLGKRLREKYISVGFKPHYSKETRGFSEESQPLALDKPTAHGILKKYGHILGVED